MTVNDDNPITRNGFSTYLSVMDITPSLTFLCVHTREITKLF